MIYEEYKIEDVDVEDMEVEGLFQENLRIGPNEYTVSVEMPENIIPMLSLLMIAMEEDFERYEDWVRFQDAIGALYASFQEP